MPVFMVERQYAERFDPDGEAFALMEEYNVAHDIRWVTSFLSADRKKTYCLYEVDDVDILRRQASDLGIPADAIVPVDELTR